MAYNFFFGSTTNINRAGLCNLSLVILGRHRPIRTQEHQVIFTKVYKVQSIYLPTHAIINYINPRPAGGGGVWTPPLRFFEDSEKTAARSAAGFSPPPYPPSFPQLLWKFQPKAVWGQVTRSGQVTQLQNNFPIAPRLQCFRESYETFGIWWGHQCLQNVYLGFLISVTSG